MCVSLFFGRRSVVLKGVTAQEKLTILVQGELKVHCTVKKKKKISPYFNSERKAGSKIKSL